MVAAAGEPGAALAEIDYHAGTAKLLAKFSSEYQGVGMKIDPATGIAATSVNNNYLDSFVAITDLKTGTTTQYPYPNAYSAAKVGIDTVNHLILLLDELPLGSAEDARNRSQGSQLVVMTETGRVVKTVPLPSLFNDVKGVEFVGGRDLAIDGTKRRLYYPSPTTEAIDVIQY
jgi:hypothetical protein